MASPHINGRRLTVSCDPTAFPCLQVYHADGKLNWDISYLYQALWRAGERREKLDWIKWCRDIVGKLGLADECVLRKPGAPNTMSTVACLSFLAATVDKSSKDSMVSACASFLRNSFARAIAAAQRMGIESVLDSLRLLPHGQVAGMQEYLATYPQMLKEAMITAWQEMQERGLLTSPWSQEMHPLADVLHVHLFFFRHRRSLRRRVLAKANSNHLCAKLKQLLQWGAANIDLYVLHEYASLHDTAAPAPSLGALGRCKRKYIKVTVDTMWRILEQARSSGISAAQVAGVRQADAELGVSRGTTLAWQGKLNFLYHQRRQMLFNGCVSHINLVADPATHGKTYFRVRLV